MRELQARLPVTKPYDFRNARLLSEVLDRLCSDLKLSALAKVAQQWRKLRALKVGEILVARKVVTADQLLQALERHGAGRWTEPVPITAPGYVPWRTKVVDGVAVTRDCWEYRSTMSCSGGASADQCALLVAAGCTPQSSTCRQTNAVTGVCEVYEDGYTCAVPAQTVTSASNTPA